MKAKKDYKYVFYFIGQTSYFLAVLGALLFPALTYLTYLRIARRGFLLSLLLATLANLFLLIGEKYISDNVIRQMVAVYFIVATIFFPMFIRNISNGQKNVWGNYNWFELIFVVAGLFFWTFLLIRRQLLPHFAPDKTVLFLVLILLTVILLSLEQLGIVMKGDSVVYYSKIIRICENFSFSPNDINLLKSSGHCCYSYSLFSSIGENIIPYHGLGVRIENIIIWLMSIVFLYKILKKILPDISQTILLGSVSSFAFTPLILGNIQEIGVELYVIFFFILFVYFNVSKKHVLEMFFAVCFVFAKEPNIAILAGYYFSILIYQIILIFKKKKLKILFDRNFVLCTLSVYLAAIVFCIYFVVDVHWGINASFDYGEMIQGNTFGISDIYILTKLKQLFVLNFAWIPTVTIIICLILYIIRKKSISEKNIYIFPLISSYICFLTIQFFYLTFVLPRYILLQYFYLVCALAFVLNRATFNPKVIKGFMFGNMLLLVCQNFYNIDLLSSLLFDTFNTGNGYMIFDNPCYIGMNGEVITYKDEEIPYIQPDGMTNKQFSYFDKMLEIALGKIEYSKNDIIVLPNSFELYPDNFYWGNQLSLYYYNIQNKQFVILTNELVPTSNEFIKINATQVSFEIPFENFDNYKNVYYFDFGFSDDIDTFIHKNYQTNKLESIEYRGWTLDIYDMEGKR